MFFGSNQKQVACRGRDLWFLAVLLLIASGIVYRVLTSRLQLASLTSVKLPIPLSDFPKEIGKWVGEELPLPSATREYMEKHFADDFLSRRYVNSQTNARADVYVVYCSSRPSGILGHRPGVCYPAQGWVHDATKPSQVVSQAGWQISCLIHRFHSPAPMYSRAIVLSFYIVNGRITIYEDDFSDPFGRKPNIAGDPARYVAQVQISSVLESSVRTAVSDMIDSVLDFLPDKNGRVRAVRYANTRSSVLK